MQFVTTIKCGTSRKNTESLTLSLSEIEGSEKNWTYRVILKGAINEDKILEGNSPFDCVVLGLAYLRQTLRRFLDSNPKMKLFENLDDSLEKIEIEDIFWTHDCVPE